jgi:hypothetical protein
MWEFSRGDNELEVDVPGQLTLDRMVLMVEVALGGLGSAHVLRDMVEAPLAPASSSTSSPPQDREVPTGLGPRCNPSDDCDESNTSALLAPLRLDAGICSLTGTRRNFSTGWRAVEYVGAGEKFGNGCQLLRVP